MEKSRIKVGAVNTEHEAIMPEKLNASLKMLEKEGYTPHDIHVENLRTGKTTTVSVLAKPEAKQ